MARRSYRVSRKLMILGVLLAFGLWRGADLLEKIDTAQPGNALVDPTALDGLLRGSGIDLDALDLERASSGPAELRNGFWMGGRKPSAGAPPDPSETVQADEAAPESPERRAPKPESMVRVRRHAVPGQ